MNIKYLMVAAFFLVGLAACNHSKPKPISNDITKTTVAVNGKKDSVINNAEKNYGNATVSEPCVKCLIAIVQATKNYKMLTTSIPLQNIIYSINWITSSKPVNVDGGKIVNGMAIDVNLKDGNRQKKLTTFLYNNENAQFYILNGRSGFIVDSKIDSISVKKIRNSCFWGVASSK